MTAAHLMIATILASSALAQPPGAPRYSIISLGTLGGPTSVALDINEHGQVVGGADLPSGLRRGFLWENGVMTDLGTLDGVLQSEAWGVNNLGQVVVIATNKGEVERSFIWHQGTRTEFGGTFPPKSAFDINDRGQIVGVMGPPHGEHAFLFDEGEFVDLGTLGGSHSIAWEINESGQVVGGAFTVLPGEHAFLWESGVMSDLGTLGGENSEAFAINDLGQVTGWAQSVPAGFFYDPFIWSSGLMMRIGPPGPALGRGEGINRHGQVILEGHLVDTATNAIWPLEELIPIGSGWSELSPRGINDIGEIVGVGTYQDSRVAFLMTHPPTSTLVSLVSAEAEPDRALLIWRVITRSRIVVDRCDDEKDWMPVREMIPEQDRVRFEDRDVRPGRRHGYRVRWSEASGREVTAGETWLEIPSRSGLALLGARPNPASSPIQIAFMLPTAGEAQLDLHDVTGRRAATSGRRFLPAGFHLLPLGTSLAPGVYVVRLTFGDRTLERRVTIVR